MPIVSPLYTRSRNILLTAAFFSALLPAVVFAQSDPQPYNAQDPQNYSSTATQAYQSQYPQQQVNPTRQGVYPGEQGVSPTQPGVYSPDQQGYPQQQGYADPGQQQNPAPYAGQQLVPQPPPPLPEYDQPEAPDEGYIWTPGYWAWGPSGYFWVAGRWDLPPYQGALYTPGYWGDYNGGYFWNTGYWGPVVGFYGGINYGFGYFGTGFYGGYWRGGRFCYNGFYNHLGPRFRGGYYNQRVGGFNPGYHFGGGRAYASVNVGRGFAGEAHRGDQAPMGRGFASGSPFGGGQQRIQGESHGVTTIQGSVVPPHGFVPQQGNFSRGPASPQPSTQFHAQPSGNMGGNFHPPSGGFSGAGQPHVSAGGGGFSGGGQSHISAGGGSFSGGGQSHASPGGGGGGGGFHGGGGGGGGHR